MQGVFLMLAQAALAGAPCPSDATLARAYGTHSTGRARRLLSYFEERGLLVVRTRLPQASASSPSPISAPRPPPATPTRPDDLGRAAAE